MPIDTELEQTVAIAKRLPASKTKCRVEEICQSGARARRK